MLMRIDLHYGEPSVTDTLLASIVCLTNPNEAPISLDYQLTSEPDI